MAFFLFYMAFYNMIAYKTVYPYRSIHDLLETIELNLPVIVLLFLLNIAITFKINKIKDIVIKIIVDLLLSVLMLVMLNLAFIVLLKIIWGTFLLDWGGSVLLNILIFLCVEVTFYIKHSTHTLKQVETARQLAIQYQYDALKAQVNPHFLFNSLNLLYSLIAIDTDQAKEFVKSLSRMYRYIVSLHETYHVLLSEELSFLRSYVDVLKLRYPGQFDVVISGEEHVKDHQIIPYTMQLLIENVTKHNVISMANPMLVKIDIKADCLTVTNHVVPKESDHVTGIGLRYISEH